MRVEVRNFKAFPLTLVSHGFNRWLTNPLKSAINVTLGWGVSPIPLPVLDLSISRMIPSPDPFWKHWAAKNVSYQYISSKYRWMTVNIWSGWSECWIWVCYCPLAHSVTCMKGGCHPRLAITILLFSILCLRNLTAKLARLAITPIHTNYPRSCFRLACHGRAVQKTLF